MNSKTNIVDSNIFLSFSFIEESSVQNTYEFKYVRISRILSLQCKTIFIDLYAYFMFRKTQTCSETIYKE